MSARCQVIPFLSNRQVSPGIHKTTSEETSTSYSFWLHLPRAFNLSIFAMTSIDRSNKLILWLNEVNTKDVALVGGKNSSLGEMYQQLTSKGILKAESFSLYTLKNSLYIFYLGIFVPNGFTITASAYRLFIDRAHLTAEIQSILKPGAHPELRGEKVRSKILSASLPDELSAAILDAYSKLGKQYNDSKDVDVAVRSSATAEDLPEASFAGQQESFLNVKGAEAVLSACKRCFASLL